MKQEYGGKGGEMRNAGDPAELSVLEKKGAVGKASHMPSKEREKIRDII